MKKLLLLVFLPVLLLTNSLISADAKKPQYKITVFQKGQEIGTIILETWPDVAPKHAHNFDSLVSIKFYDGLAFHRIISGFMIQGGDPNSRNDDRSKWGMGQPGLTNVPAEFSQTLSHKRGILSAARRGNDVNSATTQFFIMHQDAPSLDGQYSIYGNVLSGIEVVDKVAAAPKDGPRGETPVDKITMNIVRIN